ncbi:hypothetical protein YPPY66_1349, partial [Yersinia pestis PY-66]
MAIFEGNRRDALDIYD